ncbi:MAG: GAF domain-containing protein [Elusimicrobia bacterium]|nr:GAF domain-containing protein [Elusimicrobiota bacterium]
MAEEPPGIDAEDKRLKQRPSRARYDKVHLALERKWRRRELKSDRMMREIVDALWDAFAGSPYSWCGFHVLSPDGLSLVPGPHRDQAAGAASAPQGARGRALSGGAPVIVSDAGVPDEALLPGTRSEIVLPVFDAAGKIWAVFGADSAEPAAFDEMDQRWLERILKHFRDVKPPEPAR